MKKLENKKRVLVITGIHLVFSIIIFITAIILTAANIEYYPKYSHPLAFTILQWIANFPLVMLAMYATGMALAFLRFNLGIQVPIIYFILTAALIAMPLNSFLWGLGIDKIISFFDKKIKKS
jgi:hypothetical protein